MNSLCWLKEITLVPAPERLPVECWQPIQSGSERAFDFMAKHGICGIIGGGSARSRARAIGDRKFGRHRKACPCARTVCPRERLLGTYTFICTGAGGSANKTVTITKYCNVSTAYTCPNSQTIASTTIYADCSSHVTNTSCVSPTFCSPGAPTCLDPMPQFNFQARPLIVPEGNTTKLYWNVSNVNSCSVSGGGQTWNGLTSPSGGQQTNPINQQTTYTLTCTKIDNTTFSESVTISIVPVFQEK